MGKKASDEEHIDMSAEEEQAAPSENTVADGAAAKKSESSAASPDAKKSAAADGAKTGPHHRLWQWLQTHKKLSIPAAIVVVLALLAVIPFTRYALAGMVISKNFTVVVSDSQTSKPVTSATLMLMGKTVVTDNHGRATVHVKVGNGTLNVTKTYYKSASAAVLVPLGSQKQPFAISLVATGRQVPVTVVNKISGQPVANATVSAAGSKVVTDKNGEAIIVIPATSTSATGMISLSGYNNAAVTVKVTANVDPANKFAITPAGKLYFLSDASGKLDVAKSDLDGQNRQVVLAGTGQEDKFSTVLLASRDWKYIALLSKRDGGDNAKLFLIDTTANDKLTTMDEGDASFSPIGWSGDRFIYTVTRTKVNVWQNNRQAIKSYHATDGSITVLDQTQGTGTADYDTTYSSFNDTFILDKEVVYDLNWYGSQNQSAGGKQATLNSVQSDGTQKKVIKSYSKSWEPYFVGISARLGDFNEVYVQYQPADGAKNKYDSYQDGKISAATLSDNDFYSGDYHTFIVSPSSGKTLWTDYRDGKNYFLVGDGKGQNGKELPGSSSDYQAYGWYTDDYILVTKNSSELHILPASGLSGGVESSPKVGDYFKPNYNLRAYGYGYGG